jgi:hypothetical protein
LLSDCIQLPLLVNYKGLRLFGAPFAKLGKLFLPPMGGFFLFFVLFLIGSYLRRRGMVAQIVPDRHRFITMRKETNIVDHEIAHSFNTRFITLVTRNPNNP